MNHFGASATPSRLQVNISHEDDTTKVEVRGRADASNQARLKAALAEVDSLGTKAVELRLGDLDFCDVRAFSEMLEFARRVRRDGVLTSLVDPGPWLEVLVTLLDVDGDLQVRSSVQPRYVPGPTRRFDPLRDVPLSDESLLTLMTTLIHGDPGTPRMAWLDDSLDPDLG